MDEATEVWAQCQRDAGFPIEVFPDGSFGTADGAGIPREQMQAFSEAEYLCAASYPFEPKYYQPYNDAQLRAWYEYLTGEATACIEGQGYPVPAPPSVETWIQGYRSGSLEGLWNPFFDAIPDEEQEQVLAVCPLEPDNFYELATVPGE